MYRYNNSSDITINDAEWVNIKWVLATSSALTYQKIKNLPMLLPLDKHYIRPYTFRMRRDELLIGTLNGVVIVDLANLRKRPRSVARMCSLLLKTTNQYWIGTEHGFRLATTLLPAKSML
ncbi:hypothetical protein OK016_04030 [Vibrio chagasii]|nr:hypothetical protein [Vibrio chagasii]